MGKYDKLVLDVDDNVTSFDVSPLLRSIANELAEANRLKRLELKILAASMDVPNTMKEASEDRA